MNLNQYSIAAAQPGLSVERVLNLRVPVPPRSEQERLAAHIDEATSELSTAVQRTRQEIALLREFRTRLIADVVTGKLDVREAASRLPDVVEEHEPLDEIEAEDDAVGAPTDDLNEALEAVEA
jgi:type I restriction enzyme S subunit